MGERIVVAMSGGVYSSVAAALLLEQGFEVLGVTLKLWGKDVCASAGSRLCCSVRDTLDAKAICRRLRIRHEVLDLADIFRSNVIDYFLDSYRRGLTPNPCIACNDHIKFGSLLDYADLINARCVASGHYARVEYDVVSCRYTLGRAIDRSKDQSYVLFNLSQKQLARVRFPLGRTLKSDVRNIAKSLRFGTAQKPDSQDVCFIRDRDKSNFLRRELSMTDEPGQITDIGGNCLGMHRGLLGYTIGQREGIGLAVGKPLYVVKLDHARNRLVVGSCRDLLGGELIAEDVNWVSICCPSRVLRVHVKIRSKHEAASACIRPLSDGRIQVEFDEPQAAITPGQAAVFYDGELLLGGGWIAK